MAGELRVVGIGASAGGVEALTDFFTHVPPGTGLAYLVVLHLLPGHVSRLPEIIARATGLPVVLATNGALIEAERVYVIPPDSLLSVSAGRLAVHQPTMPHHQNMAVDFLFGSMAAEYGPRAIGVILSGAGSDGALGLKAIKQAGGIAVAQGSNGSRPRHGEMPAAAIAATAVDLILPVEQMAGKIASLPLVPPEPPAPDDVDDETTVPPAARAQIDDFKPMICGLLHAQLGHDFSGYKRPTFMRRVHRRMQFLNLDASAYVERLREDRQEVTLLFHDLLIGVTAFFRDLETFETIRNTIIPQIFAAKRPDHPVRVWVPGCATGEEAYTLAMLIREHMMTLPVAPRVQIFATDLDHAAIALARAGRYPSALVQTVSAERLARFFTATDGSYVVNKDIRELCTFSAHSLIRDPPFSRMDLISCRNVLIYLDADLQGRVVRTFHYSLTPGGYLILGGSEAVTRYVELFDTVDRRHRIYQRLSGASPPLPVADVAPSEAAPPASVARRREVTAAGSEAVQRANARVLDHFAPAFVVVNTLGEVVHFSSRTGKYLEAAPGAPSRDLVAMARRGLRPEVRMLLRRVTESGRSLVCERVQVHVDGGLQEISLTVEPLSAGLPETLYLVVFADVSQLLPRDEIGPPLTHDVTVDQLEHELREARQQLQSSVEEHETALEELKSSNEELHSVNEELQSTNEELETSKEEIQSINEELQTVNTQLSAKVDELDRVNSDLRNLFESTKVATIFLDRFMVIRSFTPAVAGLYNLIPGDIGRPVTDITSQLSYATLEADFRRVMQTLQPMEQRVNKQDGSTHYLMRVAPYRTADNEVDGALLTFVDVSSMVQAEQHGKLLAEELNQRVGDVVALVVELVAVTTREVAEPDAFAALYLRRINALAAACSRLMRDIPGEVRLRDVMLYALSTEALASGRVALEGPEVLLKARSAMAMGIVVHELAARAGSVGALAVSSGRIGVHWHIEPAVDGSRIVWTWEDEGGLPRQAPFDPALLELCVRQELQGEAKVEADPGVLRVTLAMKLDVAAVAPGE